MNKQQKKAGFGARKTFIYDDMGARISIKRDPFKSNKIITKKKLYNGKASLLPEVFTKYPEIPLCSPLHKGYKNKIFISN